MSLGEFLQLLLLVVTLFLILSIIFVAVNHIYPPMLPFVFFIGTFFGFVVILSF